MSKHIYTLEITVNDPSNALTRTEVLDIVDNQMVPLFVVKGGTAKRSAPIVVVEHEIKMVEQEVFVGQDKFDNETVDDTKTGAPIPAGKKAVTRVGDKVKTTPKKPPVAKKA